MPKQQDNWKKRFEKFTNKSGFSNYECTNWKIKMTAKEFMPYIQKELDKAREEEWSATRMLWDRMDKWQKEWKKENPKERKLVFNDALKLIEWKIITAREEERKELLEKIEKIYEKNNLAKN